MEWNQRAEQFRITENALVTITFNGITAHMEDGHLQISRLNLLDRPDMSYNIFKTALPEWFANKPVIARAITSWEQLEEKNKQLLNAILFEGNFFKRVCTGPSSVNHHHSYPNGNLEHTLEVVSFISDNIKRYPTADLQLALIYGWCHDIGKANEYQKIDMAGDRQYKLTAEAYLHGHKMNGLHYVVQARSRYVQSYPSKTFDHLRHLLEACVGTNSSNLRKPQMLEHLIIQQADAASAAANIYSASHRSGQSYGNALVLNSGRSLIFRYEK